MYQKVRFEKHQGELNFSDGTAVFYNLIFKNIIQAGNFLRHLNPGNFKGWVNDEQFGVVDLDSGWIYTNSSWYPPNSIKLYIYDDTQKPDSV